MINKYSNNITRLRIPTHLNTQIKLILVIDLVRASKSQLMRKIESVVGIYRDSLLKFEINQRLPEPAPG